MSEHTPSPINRDSWHYRLMNFYYSSAPWAKKFTEPQDICAYRKGVLVSLAFTPLLVIVVVLMSILVYGLMTLMVGVASLLSHKPKVGYRKFYNPANDDLGWEFEQRLVFMPIIGLLVIPLADLFLHGWNGQSIYSWAVLSLLGFFLAIAIIFIGVFVIIQLPGLVRFGWANSRDKFLETDTGRFLNDSYTSIKNKVCWRVEYTGGKGGKESV